MPTPAPPVDPLPLLRLILAGGRRASRHELLRSGGTGDAGLQARIAGVPASALDRALAWLDGPGHHLVGSEDPRYPALLRQAPHPPLALFIDGDPDALWQPAVAVVGSRNASAAGCENTRRFAGALCRGGLAITSFGDYTWMWWADIALALLAAVLNLPIREARVRQVAAA